MDREPLPRRHEIELGKTDVVIALQHSNDIAYLQSAWIFHEGSSNSEETAWYQ
jgi:hypothetical protein